MNKAGSLPSDRVMLSLALERYYGPLRLPPEPPVTSVSLIHGGCRSSGDTLMGLQHWAACLPPHAAPATPGDRADRSCSWVYSLRPSPHDHRVGIPNTVTGLLVGSLSLRPVALPAENLRPLITQTPLSCATEVNRQFLGRDFNPLGRQRLLRTVKSALDSC